MITATADTAKHSQETAEYANAMEINDGMIFFDGLNDIIGLLVEAL